MWFKNIKLNKLKYLSISSSYIKLHPSVVYFHKTAFQNAKQFVDTENNFAHKILEKYPNYILFTEPILPLELSTNSTLELSLKSITTESNPVEVYDCFKNLVYYCKQNEVCISNDLFDNFVDIFTEKCHQFSDSILIDSLKLMTLLPKTPYARSKNFVELWNALDDACTSRLENWETDQVLLVCDCWYALNIVRLTDFIWLAVRKMGRKIKKLEPHQLLQSLFYCNLIRNPKLDMFDYEVAFPDIINQMSIEEIAVMSMGFFKTKTRIKNQELIDTIYKRLIPEVDKIEDITLVNILKILRYSSSLPQATLMHELLDKISPQIERISLFSCLHVALLGCDIQLCHKDSLQKIVDRFLNEIESCRLKDMERICHVISLSNYETDRTILLCGKILELLENKVDEIIQYPQCFPLCLHYLSLCGFYRNDYISSVLSPKFIRHAYKRNVLLGREIFSLDSFAKINLKDNYSGNQLTDKQRSTFGQILTQYIPERNPKYKLNATDTVLLEIKEVCYRIFKGDIALKHILPHFERCDIVICYDKLKKEAIEIKYSKDYSGTILTKDLIVDTTNPNIETIVIVIGGWNNIVRDQNRATGLLKMKLHQLSLLGYKTIMVPWYEWRALETFKDRKNYIQRKLINLL